jgi:hypothetical protein
MPLRSDLQASPVAAWSPLAQRSGRGDGGEGTAAGRDIVSVITLEWR